MKSTLTLLALTAILAGTSHAAISGKKPAFMDKQQLATMRAEAASNSIKETEDSAFFTGKPYLASTDRYAFKYRSYSPTTARWSSEDPSGFPDGANANSYAPNPTSEADAQGLWKIKIIGSTSNTQTLSTTSGSVSATASITAVGSGGGWSGSDGWGYDSVDLSGYANAVWFRPGEPDGDIRVDSYGDPLKANLSITDSGLFTRQSLAGSSFEQNSWLRLGVGLSVRIDENDPKYAYAMITASAGIRASGLTGFGVSLGPVGVSASFNQAPQGQRPVETIELKFQIVE